MKKTLSITLAACLLAMLASGAAHAYPDRAACVGCHPQDANVVVTVTPGACAGTNHTYSVSVSNTYDMWEGWAVFDGTTNIRNGYGTFGTFMVGQDKTFVVRGVSDSDLGYGGGKGGSNLATITVPHCQDCSQDADADGFFAEAAGCGPRDCNDADATVFPGAAEIKKDGIDQDCNGYDLTIAVTKAAWSSRKNTVTVWATSDLGPTAYLFLYQWNSQTGAWAPVNNMGWNMRTNRWELTYGTSVNPGQVRVVGVEGAEIATVSSGR